MFFLYFLDRNAITINKNQPNGFELLKSVLFIKTNCVDYIPVKYFSMCQAYIKYILQIELQLVLIGLTNTFSSINGIHFRTDQFNTSYGFKSMRNSQRKSPAVKFNS